MDERIERIRRLEERIRELEASEENKIRAGFWKDDPNANDYQWHPSPKEKGRVPFVIEYERVGYAQSLGFSVVKFYEDPVEFILRSLEIAVFKFENFNDCTPIGRVVTYWPGAGYEASLMGQPQEFTEEDSWVGRTPVLQERVSLDRLEPIDFFHSPVMKFTHSFYARMKELVSDDFEVIFPQWCRSPWGVAWHIRGIDNLVMDYIEDFEWTYGLLQRLCELRIDFSVNREKFLNIPRATANLYNDEVTVPVVSPQMYTDLIRPSEIAVSEFFGGINYWHSCGDTTALMPEIDKIPDMKMVHVSPWSDFHKAAESYDPATKTLEIVLHPLLDVMDPPNAQYPEEHLIEAREATKAFYTTVRADGFTVMGDKDVALRRVQDWVATANKVLLDGERG